MEYRHIHSNEMPTSIDLILIEIAMSIKMLSIFFVLINLAAFISIIGLDSIQVHFIFKLVY